MKGLWVTAGHFLVGESEPSKGCKQGSALIRFDFRNITLVGEDGGLVALRLRTVRRLLQ